MVSRQATNTEFFFHGTRYWSQIESEDRLRRSPSGVQKVSLTSDFTVAQYWAGVPRDLGDDDHGHILVLDRASLEARYRVEPFIDLAFSGQDEHEHCVWTDITGVSEFVRAAIPALHRPPHGLAPSCGKYTSHGVTPANGRRMRVAFQNDKNENFAATLTCKEAIVIGIDLINAGTSKS